MATPKISPQASPIARVIYQRMLEKGISPKALSVQSGRNPGYARDLFRGKSKNPKTDELARIARTLGSNVEELQRAASFAQQGQDLDEQPPDDDLLRELMAQRAANKALMIKVWEELGPDDQVLALDFIVGLLSARPRGT